MIKNITYLLILFLCLSSVAPGFSPTPFPFNNQLFLFHDGQLLVLPTGKVQFYFNTGGFTTTDTIKLTESADGGYSWSTPRTLFLVAGAQTDSLKLSVDMMPDGRLCMVFAKQGSLTYNRFYRSFSADNGLNWTEPAIFGTGLGVYGKGAYIKTIGNRVFIFYSSSANTVKYRISLDSGKTYGAESAFFASANNYRKFNGLAAVAGGKLLSFFSDDRSGKVSVYASVSTDNGVNWQQETILTTDSSGIFDCSVLGNGQNEIYLLYSKTILSKHRNIPQKEIYYIKSTDAGINWNIPVRYTNFPGNDIKPFGCYSTGEPLIFFLSSRGSNNITSEARYLYMSKLLTGPDNSAPPVLLSSANTQPVPNQPVWVVAAADDESEITSVVCAVSTGGPATNITLFDDGLHNDGAANDYVWGGIIGAFGYSVTVTYNFIITNTVYGPKTFYNNGYFQMPSSTPDVHILAENKIYFPLDHKGILADAGGSLSGGKLDGQSIVFSGGFYLSGKKGDSLWANGQMSSSRIADYLPGYAGADATNPEFQLFIVNAGDSAFGTSWQKWRKAVEFGADFYDGNGDNLYNPVDLNGNGQWDPSEDKPDLIGNETVWCIYNDSEKPNLRRFNTIWPQLIEIHQTAYEFKNTESGLNNAVFVRYKLINKNNVTYDSVYFSLVADPDIGLNYSDDYAGSDTLLHSGYAYKRNSDPGGFGANPPAVFLTLLQGPHTYIPGVTFTDVNANGVYDEGIDIPLMNALNYRGPLLGTDTIKGAMNLPMTSFQNYMSSHPTLGDPATPEELRNYQLGGREKSGTPVNVCTFAYGNGSQLSNCSLINPRYFFSGDPVSSAGWRNTVSSDQRLIVTAGPFKLQPNKPVNIVSAYTSVRGSDALNSITVTRQSVSGITEAFKNNFPVVVGIKEKVIPVKEAILYQNYPNPAAELTILRYKIASDERVRIKVFDLLGNTVANLLDEVKTPGTYEIEVNTRNFASGIYFCEMKAGEYYAVKKFLVVR